ncbi:LysM peptidoglycan-binding domain-containing protein [Paraburkholderia bannensis]|uniref:LysM peptidoglycan-binding domain-containing protein n=1 Tax=Paraburkholderia bannensis TaxID=765414 RepID=UPI002AB7DD5F|nr:LysM peptidoglycan-binding domain-containing protein [Paraburkholderia bannensis]
MFVRATYDRENRTVHYFDADGNETLYIGGSFAWRTTNPGNLTKPGGYLIKSAIGYAQRTKNSKGRFVIFPDRAAGQQAHQQLLKTVYGDSTIRSMITSYAPPSENDTEKYIQTVTKSAGVSSTDVVGKLPEDKFLAVSAAMERQEGWVPGVIKHLGKPVQVQVVDKLSQAFAGQPIQLQGSAASVNVKTDENGSLPWLYSGLLGQEVNLTYKREDGHETVGQVSTTSEINAFTFSAPYMVVETRPRLHAKDASTRPRVHIVQAGETLTSIAKRYGTTIESMVALNALKDANHIYAHQHLKVPVLDGDDQAAQQPAAKAPVKASGAGQQPGLASGASAQSSSATTASTSASTPVSTTAVSTAASTTVPQAPHPATPHPAATTPHPSVATTSASAATPHPAPHPAPAATAPAASLGNGVVNQSAPNGHPQTVVSSPNREPSGAQWCHHFPGSESLGSLNDAFKPKATAFVGALRDAQIAVTISAAFRPIPRSYLMYYSFQIAKESVSPDHVPPWPDVNIDWVHRNPDGSMNRQQSVAAARAMCLGFGIHYDSAGQAVGRPGRSRHNYGGAVDLHINGYVGKRVKDFTGAEVLLHSFADLKQLGHGYGVIYYPHENMHWSDTGH